MFVALLATVWLLRAGAGSVTAELTHGAQQFQHGLFKAWLKPEKVGCSSVLVRGFGALFQGLMAAWVAAKHMVTLRAGGMRAAASASSSTH